MSDSTEPTRYVKVGHVDDFKEGRGLAVPLGDRKVAVFRVGGRLKALDDYCPHMGASLADGKIVGGREVVCHMHEWKFDLDTGQGDQRQWACARVYEVKVDGNDVLLRQPEPDAEPEEDEPWVEWDDRFLKAPGKDPENS